MILKMPCILVIFVLLYEKVVSFSILNFKASIFQSRRGAQPPQRFKKGGSAPSEIQEGGLHPSAHPTSTALLII